MVPSFKALTLMLLIDQVPPEPTVVVCAVVECVPSVTTTEIVAPTSPVPLIVVVVLLELLTGLVTVVTLTAGATVSFAEVLVAFAEFPAASVAVAV